MKFGEKLLFSQEKNTNLPGFESGWFESLRCWYYSYKQLISYCHLQSWSHSSTFMRKFFVFSVRGVLCRSDLLSNTRGNLTTDFNKCTNVPNLWPITLALHQRVNLSHYYYFCARDHWRKLKSTFHIYILYLFLIW